MHVLLVEDDPRLQRVLRRLLEDDRHVVEVAPDGETALELAAATQGIETVILDIGLPDISGIDVARRLRHGGRELSILMLTARDTINDRVAGLDAGADDYLVKPFALDELRARVRALLRRASGGTEVLEFQDVRMDLRGATVTRADRRIPVTRTEYDLLELLIRNPRRVLPHDLIYDRVWGYDFGPTSNALRVYIGYLRRKLQTSGARPLLHTVRGVGYVLREP